ncbi:MAG: MerR family transcriptional regulator [Lachnospiraceae bacterium]|nr:MerR family transcriptional regulator [Lachnospiraceae bacterium]
MGEAKYRIGDVANLMGLSRDTLRHYEKCGILMSEKGDNGYRYYTDQDISRLLGVLYQRKMDIGLNEIAALWTHDDSLSQLAGITDARLKEEELAIRRHQQIIARLQLTRMECENFRTHLDQVVLKELPKSYVIVPRAGFEECTQLWFQYAKDYPGMDMTYLFDEYHWKYDEDTLCLDYRNSQLTLMQDLAEHVDYEFSKENPAVTQPTLCISTYCLSNTRVPDPRHVLPMIDWARQQGLMTSHQLYCTFAMQGLNDGQHSYYMQIYLPVF